MSDGERHLPPGWASTTIGEVVEPKVPQGVPSAEDDFTYIDIGSIDNESKRIASPKTMRGSEAPSRARQNVCANDVLVSMTRPNLNAVAKVPESLDGAVCSTGFDVLRTAAVEPDWLFLTVRSKPFVDSMSELVQGALYPAVRAADVRGFELPVPPLREQHRIVAKIEALQERTRRAREALAEVGPLLEQFRQSVLAAAFRGDLSADWRATHPDVEPASELLARIRAERRRRWEEAELEKYGATSKRLPKNWRDGYPKPEPAVDSDLPALPETWCWTTLDELAYSMRSGNATTSVKSPTDWPILRSSAVRPSQIDYGDVNYMVEGADVGNATLLSDGDLLVTRLSGSLEYVGVCAIVRDLRGRLIQYPDRVFRVRVCPGPALPYVEYSFRHGPLRRGLEEAAKSSAGHQRISLSDLRRFRLPLAPGDEQEIIADMLERFFRCGSAVAAGCRSVLQEADQLDQSILAKAFRGELVPQAPLDEPASVLLERIRTARAAATKDTKPRGTKSRRPRASSRTVDARES